MKSKELKEAICDHIKVNPGCVKKLFPVEMHGSIDEAILTNHKNWYRIQKRKAGKLTVRTFMCTSPFPWFVIHADSTITPWTAKEAQANRKVPYTYRLFSIALEVTTENDDSMVSHYRFAGLTGETDITYLE